VVSVTATLPLGAAPLRSGSRRGFLLADVLVASVILAVALSVLISMAGTALASQQTGEQIGTAAQLADEQLNLVLMRGPDSYASRFPIEGPCEGPFEAYRFRLDFTDGDSGKPYGVGVRIDWTSARGPQSIRIETRIAPRLGDEPDPDRKPEETVSRE